MPYPTFHAPAHPLPVARLALSLTGYQITGANGVAFDGVSWPAGPYAITDEAGAVFGSSDLNWIAEKIAVRTWRNRVESTDYCLTREAVAEQLRLKVELR